MINCDASQCKRKQWCKRYQLYQLYLQSINSVIPQLQNPVFLNQDVIFVNFKQVIQRHQSVDMYRCFIPTEQYTIKEKLDKLNKLDNY